MKRILSFLVLLCLFLRSAAQENIEDRGVHVGDLVPDVTVTGATHVKVNERQLGNSFRVADLRGRLVILDFWKARWVPSRSLSAG